jgi:two-component system alkaline phosphatase synthesis response regulator PhoP
MTSKFKILVIEDDGDTRHILGTVLRAAGYEILLAGDAERALAQLADFPADIVISDIGLPGLSGLDLLKYLRARNHDGEVILLTGFPAVDSAIQALRDGAVDYLTKPVTPPALLEAIARVEERLRQTRQRREALAMLEAGIKHFMGQPSSGPVSSPGPPPAPAAGKLYEVGPVTLDPDRFLVEVNGQRVDATPTEVGVLHYLCRHPGRVVTPQELVKSLRDDTVASRAAPEIIRPHISNLRRKLLAASPQADVIATVRGVGYMLKTPPT